MAKPKPPTGCRVKGGRYYRVRYIGTVDGKSRYQWHALSRVADGLPALYAELEELDSRPMHDKQAIADLKAFINKAFRSCVRRSAERGIENDLTLEFLLDLAKQNFWRCAVTGIAFDLTQANKHHGRPFAPSIDRIKADGGYTHDNVRIVCLAANYAMNQWGHEILQILLTSYGEFVGANGKDSRELIESWKRPIRKQTAEAVNE